MKDVVVHCSNFLLDHIFHTALQAATFGWILGTESVNKLTRKSMNVVHKEYLIVFIDKLTSEIKSLTKGTVMGGQF